MPSGHVTVDLPGTPPSLNRIGSRGSHWAYTKAKKQWQNDLGLMLMAERLPRGLLCVEAQATLRFPLRRRRDPGNWSWFLEKVTGDALTTGGFLPDDTARYFHWHGVRLLDEPGPALTSVFVRYELAAAA